MEQIEIKPDQGRQTRHSHSTHTKQRVTTIKMTSIDIQMKAGFILSIILHSASTQPVMQLNMPFGGIVVPGQTVDALDTFKLIDSSCHDSNRQVAKSLARLGTEAENAAKKIYNSLYFSVAEIQIESLLGLFYIVGASPELDLHRCAVSELRLLSNSPYLQTVEILTKYRAQNGIISTDYGYGEKLGPDAAHLLLNFNIAAQKCPFTIVKTGTITSSKQYPYVILTQLLKKPTIILAKDTDEFGQLYRADVDRFLQSQGYANSTTTGKIEFVDWKTCDLTQFL